MRQHSNSENLRNFDVHEGNHQGLRYSLRLRSTEANVAILKVLDSIPVV